MRANVHTPAGVKTIEVEDPPPALIANLFVHCGVIMPAGVHVYRPRPFAGGKTCADTRSPRQERRSTLARECATLIPYAGRE